MATPHSKASKPATLLCSYQAGLIVNPEDYHFTSALGGSSTLGQKASSVRHITQPSMPGIDLSDLSTGCNPPSRTNHPIDIATDRCNINNTHSHSCPTKEASNLISARSQAKKPSELGSKATTTFVDRSSQSAPDPRSEEPITAVNVEAPVVRGTRSSAACTKLSFSTGQTVKTRGPSQGNALRVTDKLQAIRSQRRCELQTVRTRPRTNSEISQKMIRHTKISSASNRKNASRVTSPKESNRKVPPFQLRADRRSAAGIRPVMSSIFSFLCSIKCTTGMAGKFLYEVVAALGLWKLDQLDAQEDQKCQESMPASDVVNKTVSELESLPSEIDTLDFLHSGGSHDVWLLTFKPDGTTDHESLNSGLVQIPDQVIIRLRRSPEDPKEEFPGGIATQVRNEVGVRQFLRERFGDAVPTPRIFAWDDGLSCDDGQKSIPFIAEEYVKGSTLSHAWTDVSDEDKDKTIINLSKILITLASAKFQLIGGFDPDYCGPVRHLEHCMLDVYRYRFRHWETYDVGPYSTVGQYAMAMITKEKALYQHLSSIGNATRIGWDEEYEDTYGSIDLFIQFLDMKYKEIEQDKMLNLPLEDFIISHGDLASRNIMVDGSQITAILDWEYATILPRAEFFASCSDNYGVEFYSQLMDADYSEEIEDKNTAAHCRLMDLFVEEGRNRGMKECHVRDIISCQPANAVRLARLIMTPDTTMALGYEDFLKKAGSKCRAVSDGEDCDSDGAQSDDMNATHRQGSAGDEDAMQELGEALAVCLRRDGDSSANNDIRSNAKSGDRAFN